MPAGMVGEEIEIDGHGHDHEHEHDGHRHHRPHVAVVARPVAGGPVPSPGVPGARRGQRTRLMPKGTDDVRLTVRSPGRRGHHGRLAASDGVSRAGGGDTSRRLRRRPLRRGPRRPGARPARRRGDPVRAEAQQRYMKSAMPYRGLTSPELRALLRPLLAAYPGLASRLGGDGPGAVGRRDAPRGVVRRPGGGPAPAGPRLARPRVAPAVAAPGRTGAWWDVVDETATHLVRDTLLATARRSRR